MNPDQPSREHIEGRLTALLLGELPADEAELLRYTISQDAALKKLHDELAATIVLVREAVNTPADAPAEKAEPLKLSGDRREKLLAHFQTAPKDEPLFWLKRIEMPHVVTVLVCISLIGLLAAMLLPALSSAKKKAQHVTMLGGSQQNQGEGTFANTGPTPAPATPAPATEPAPPAPTTPAPATVATVAAPVAIQPPSSVRIALPPTDTSSISGTAGDIAALDKTPSPSVVNSMPPIVARDGTSGVAEDTYVIKPGDTLSRIALDHGTTVKALEEANNLSSSKILAGAKMKMPVTDEGGVYSQHIVGYVGIVKNTGTDGEMTLPPSAPAALPPGEIAPAYFGTSQIAAADQTKTVGVVNGLASNGDNRGFGGGAGGGGGFAGVNRNTSALQQGKQNDSVASGTSGDLAWTQNDLHQKIGNLMLADGSVQSATVAGLSNYVTTKSTSSNSEATFSFADSGPVPAGNADDTTFAARLPAQNAPEAPAVMPPDQSPTLAQAELPKDAAADSEGFNSGMLKTDLPVYGERKEVASAEPPQAGYRFYSLSDTTVSGTASEKVPMLGDTPVLGQLTRGASGSIAAAEPNRLPASDGNGNTSDTLTLNGVNAFAGKPSDRDDLSSVSYLLSTNTAAVQNDDEARLAQLEQERRLLESKVKMAKIDYDLPIYTMVQITDPAEPSKKQTLWQGLTGEYASTATMKVENEGFIMPNKDSAPAAQNYSYDPFFIQTTFEVMKSQLVLTNVVNSLDLETKWAPSNGGQKLLMSEAMERLKSEINFAPVRNTKMVSITVTSGDPQEAADIANAIAKSYQSYRQQNTKKIQADGLKVLESQLAAQDNQIQETKAKLAQIDATKTEAADRPLPKPAPNMPIPQPEVLCTENTFSTFALNVSDVSFQLAAASLERGQLPEPASIRSEEFINAFDYRDPEATSGQPLAFTTERARYPFAQNRDLLRFSVKAAAVGRPAGRALNLVVLLDISGSMERADRVAIIREALRVLASQLQAQDTVSVVTFARTARLWADGISGDKASETLDRVGGITPEGGTNLEEAMRLAYATARRHYLANGMNRVVLLTDGAANLGDVEPSALQQNVETQRKQGIALDCFGVGFEDYNDDLLEQLSSHGDGRYAFLNSPEDASKEFAAKLAGALQIAAQDVKVQVEFNPERVISWRQIGYAKHQLTKQQFRDNTVAAGEIAAQEAGNALYTVETKPDGTGPVATVRVRYRVPGTQDVEERSWLVNYNGTAPALENSSPAMRLAGTASAFSEWLAASPFAQEVTLDELQKILSGVPQVYSADENPKKLETMLREAKSISGK